MRLVDELLEDEQLLDTVYEAQGERHPQSRSRGRMQTPAEVALRLLLLKHIRNWSYDVLEREVRANLVYRAFTRIGDEKVPDAKTLARLGQVIGPRVIEQLHQRVVELAQERGVTQGKKLRVDTTVVESNIHYPTDSSLLGDGTRALSTLLLSSIEIHQQRLGRIPRMVAADAGFYSRENEKTGQALGVKWMSVPSKKTTSSERKCLQHQRWFRRGQKWRTGSERRISVLKRRHGLRRCLYPGLDGMRRWVGLGVIADNVIQMGCYLARQST